jgi:hypothetical protein
MEPIVRAIDVGYRMTKYVERMDGPKPVCRAFPSIAPVASDRDHSLGRGSQRNNVTVRAGNQHRTSLIAFD